MKIQLLHDLVINQIAAGEVVDRPASVVRELVDNAIDAGAKDVAVYLEEGGRNLIRVLDDGSGMERDDAVLAFERHATSKIRQAEDLLTIGSLGFRGEALPSIASIAKVKLRSRRANDTTGTEVTIEGGVLKGVTPSVCPVGTEVEVRNLFFNTPARKKFLRQPKTEILRIKQWLLSSSLAWPGIRYRLFSDGSEILNLARRDSAIERGKELVRGSAVSFDHQQGQHRVAGLVAHPSLASFDSGTCVLLVNGRLVTDRMLLRAVRDGFDTTLKHQEYPVGFISIVLPPELVDVNVHPQKSEVRFRDGKAVFSLVYHAVLNAVRRFRGPTAGADGSGASLTESCSSQRTIGATPAAYTFAAAEQPDLSWTGKSQGQLWGGSEDQQAAEKIQFSALRYVGQVLGCYLLCEHQDELYIVDMHAAHERYNYNVIRNAVETRAVASQRLLMPITVTLSAEGLGRVLEEVELFSSFGFEIEAFGDDAVVVRAAPAMLDTAKIELLMRELAALPEGASAGERYKEQIDKISARIACHASIRSGYEIKREEVYALFSALDNSAFSAACPHGRPVVVRFSEDQIERWFGRDR